LFGLLAVSTYVHKPALGRQARALTGQIVMLIVINLVIGFGAGGVFGAQIDNAAHIGGLIAGAWLGLTVVPRGMSTLASFWSAPESGSAPGADPRLRALIQLGAIIAVLVVVIIGLSITPLWLGSVR
jgi:hypothetical protein